MSYAGLHRRASAFLLDYLIIAAYLVGLFAVFFLVRAALPDVTPALFGGAFRGQLSGFLLITMPVVLYYAISESSDRRGTWGKQRTGLQVVGVAGGRIGFGRALARSAAKFAPWELAHTCIWQLMFAGPNPSVVLLVALGTVYVLIGANLLSAILGDRNQALYDRLVGTVVVRSASTSV